MLQTAGSAYGKDQLESLPVDGYSGQSDFKGHQGHLDVLSLKAGSYQLSPWTANPYVKGVKIPKMEFTVESGGIVYIGEYWMPVACTWKGVIEMRDSSKRDIALLKQQNQAFENTPITKSIAIFTGYILDAGK